MNRKIAKLFWPLRRLMGVAVGVIGVVLLAVSIAGALHGMPPEAPRRVAGAQSETPSNNSREQPAPQPAAEQSPAPTPAPQHQTSTSQAQNTASQTNTPNPSNPQPATIEVSLTIRNTYKGKVSLPAGSNQCDVLRQAQADGLVGNVALKYNSALKSDGVYIIDGVGDKNTVWWTYKVNDKSPPVGCSQVVAHQGDSVKWEYVKN